MENVDKCDDFCPLLALDPWVVTLDIMLTISGFIFLLQFIIGPLTQLFQNGLSDITNLTIVPYGNARVIDGITRCQVRVLLFLVRTQVRSSDLWSRKSREVYAGTMSASLLIWAWPSRYAEGPICAPSPVESLIKKYESWAHGSIVWAVQDLLHDLWPAIHLLDGQICEEASPALEIPKKRFRD